MPDDASLIPDLTAPPAEDRHAASEDYGADLAELAFKTAKNEYDRKEHLLLVERTMLSQRKYYAFGLLTLSCVWLWFIGKYLWHFGEATIASPQLIKPVSDAVIIALITTTTVNVLGLFYIVARWLFPQPPMTKATDQSSN